MRITIEYQEGKTPTVVTAPAAGPPGTGDRAVAQTFDGGAAPDFASGGAAGDVGEAASGGYEEEFPDVSSGDALNAGPAPDAPFEGFEMESDSVTADVDEDGGPVNGGAMADDYRVH